MMTPSCFVDLGVGAFDLHDKQRLAHWVARLGEGLRRLDAGAVHELDRNGQDARLDDVGHAGTGHLVRIEPHQHGPRALGLAQDAQRRLGHHAKLPFRSADHTQQVIARRVQMRAADLQHLAVHRDHGHAHEVVRGHAVFSGNARRRKFIATLPAMAQASWLDGSGGVEENPLSSTAPVTLRFRAPRLHADEAVVVVDFRALG